MSTSKTLSKRLGVFALCATLGLSTFQASFAQSVTPSDASAFSLLPVAMIVAAPSMLLAGGAMLTVVTVQASARGSLWVLERASDGARFTLELLGNGIVSAGTAIVVSALAGGWLLSAAGQAVCFVPNEIGASLLYNERITR
jgi:hypothetical protein